MLLPKKAGWLLDSQKQRKNKEVLQMGTTIPVLESEDELHVCNYSPEGVSEKGTFIKYLTFKLKLQKDSR